MDAAGTAVVGSAALGLASQATKQSNDPDAEEGRTQLDDTLDFGGITGDPMGGLFNQGGMVPVMSQKVSMWSHQIKFKRLVLQHYIQSMMPEITIKVD